MGTRAHVRMWRWRLISAGRRFDSGCGLIFLIYLAGGWLRRNHPGATTQVGVVADGFLEETTLGGCGGGDPDVFCVEIDSALAPQLVCARFLTELDFNRL